MAVATSAGAQEGAGAAPALPPISVSRFQEATRLLERVVNEKVDIFIGHASEYRARHRDATRRELTGNEAAQIAVAASAMFDDTVPFEERATKIQASGLRAHDEVTTDEVLLAAGLQTAPEFVDAVLMVVALLEMPADEFKTARQHDTLQTSLERAAEELGDVDMDVMRDRAKRALAHLAEKAGAPPGEAWGLLGRTVWQALRQGMTHLFPTESTSTSLSGSLDTDGAATSSSTSSPTETPST